MGRTIATSSQLAKGMARLADVPWKLFLSRFRSYSVTRYRPTFLVLTFGRRSDGQLDARREDYRSILDVVSPPGAQVVECRVEAFLGAFILTMPKRTSVGSHLPRSGATA